MGAPRSQGRSCVGRRRPPVPREEDAGTQPSQHPDERRLALTRLHLVLRKTRPEVDGAAAVNAFEPVRRKAGDARVDAADAERVVAGASEQAAGAALTRERAVVQRNAQNRFDVRCDLRDGDDAAIGAGLDVPLQLTNRAELLEDVERDERCVGVVRERHECVLFAAGVERDHRVGSFDRNVPRHQSAHESEHRGVAPDAERDGEDEVSAENVRAKLRAGIEIISRDTCDGVRGPCHRGSSVFYMSAPVAHAAPETATTDSGCATYLIAALSRAPMVQRRNPAVPAPSHPPLPRQRFERRQVEHGGNAPARAGGGRSERRAPPARVPRDRAGHLFAPQ
jgi:hypothetical protein